MFCSRIVCSKRLNLYSITLWELSSFSIVANLSCLGWWIWNSCSTSQTGDLTKSDRAVDGIFGFGQQGLSVISQLSSQGITPKTFSHCLKGSNGGGGVLVLGEIVEPNIVYSPLVPSQYVSYLLVGICYFVFIVQSLLKYLWIITMIGVS